MSLCGHALQIPLLPMPSCPGFMRCRRTGKFLLFLPFLNLKSLTQGAAESVQAKPSQALEPTAKQSVGRADCRNLYKIRLPASFSSLFLILPHRGAKLRDTSACKHFANSLVSKDLCTCAPLSISLCAAWLAGTLFSRGLARRGS